MYFSPPPALYRGGRVSLPVRRTSTDGEGQRARGYSDRRSPRRSTSTWTSLIRRPWRLPAHRAGGRALPCPF